MWELQIPGYKRDEMKDVAALMAKRFTVSQVIHYDGAILPSGEVPRVGIPKHEVLSCTIIFLTAPELTWSLPFLRRQSQSPKS